MYTTPASPARTQSDAGSPSKKGFSLLSPFRKMQRAESPTSSVAGSESGTPRSHLIPSFTSSQRKREVIKKLEEDISLLNLQVHQQEVKHHFALAAVAPEGSGGGKPAKRVAAALNHLEQQGMIEEFGDSNSAAPPEGNGDFAGQPGGRSSGCLGDGGGGSSGGGSKKKSPSGRRFVRSTRNVLADAVERELAALGEAQGRGAAGSDDEDGSRGARL
eukprot:gene2660-2959_t